jgi:hypothetical protein
MNRQDIYEIAEKVEEQWNECGKVGSKGEFAADVAVRAVRLKLNEMANEVEAMPFGDTGASFAVWIRRQI